MNFTEEVRALFGQYNNNIKIIRNDSTSMIFTYILRDPNNQVVATNIHNIQIGKFYIIRYNYNGNRLWCPILTIPPLPNKNENGILERQLKLINNKSIMYAINFDYLPLQYKIMLIESILNNNSDHYEKNVDMIALGQPVKNEFNFKINWIYNFLKSNGQKNYAITAYDLNKIDKIFEISCTLLQRFVFVDTYYINNRLMYETLNTLNDQILIEEFTGKIKTYEEILKMYETDVEKFYRSLRSFEKNLKLISEL